MVEHKSEQEQPEPGRARQSHAVYLREHLHCTICDTELEIFHEINAKECNIKEEAYCHRCGVRARSTAHTIQ